MAVIVAAIMGWFGFRGRNEMPHVELRQPVRGNPIQELQAIINASALPSSMTTTVSDGDERAASSSRCDPRAPRLPAFLYQFCTIEPEQTDTWANALAVRACLFNLA